MHERSPRHKNRAIAGILALLTILPFGPTSGQTNHTFVTLRVKHDGKTIPPPGQVTLIFNGRSLGVPLRRGQFEVPHAALRAKQVRLLATVGGERIHISGIYGSAFQQDEWTLVLADHQYDTDNQWAVPKGTSVRSSCILVFESKSAEGTSLFEPHCR